MSGTMQRKILLTRAEEDCAAWAAELEALGLAPVIFPCIECRDLDTPGLRARLAAELSRARWLAFTSRRGVAAFARLHGGGRREGRDWKVAAVGPATAEAAEAAIGRADVVGTGGTAASLADALAHRLEPGDRVLAAVAENAGHTLEEALADAGGACARVEVYRTSPAPPRSSRRALSTLRADAVFLASPSAVTGFVNRVHLDTALDIFTIGPSTTEAARAAGLDVTGEAPRPGLHGLLEAMRCAI